MSRKLDFSKLKFSDKVISMEEALKDVETWIDFDNEDNKEERYCTVAESLEQSLIKMQLMREGKISKKTWREFMEDKKSKMDIKQCLKEQLKNALVKFSYGQLIEEKAEQISEKTIDKIDLTNSILNHKGINWCAKEILSLMGIRNNKYQTLSQIREKNRTSTTLLGSSIQPQEYSEELVKQGKEEFDTFVKPIRDKVIDRNIE